MKKTIYIYIIGALLLSLASEQLHSQNTSNKRYYSFERLETSIPQITSGNASGLIFNTLDNFSTIGMYFSNESGSFKNFYEPEKYSFFGLDTKSYGKLNKLYFYGRFNYDYGIKQNQAWSGTIYPNSVINPILDSIPGKVLNESYIMSAKVAYMISKKSALGLSFDYQAATGAKRRDMRNLNTMSKFLISPGYSYASKNVRLGFNAVYQHNVEKVSYSNVGEAIGKHLYFMEGFWFYNKATITNVMVKNRGYMANVFGASVQAEFKLGRVSFYNQFSADLSNEDDFEDQALTKRYALVKNLKYKYTGQLKHVINKFENSLNFSFVNEENASYYILNSYDDVPGELNSKAWYELGKDLRYLTGIKQYSIEYKFSIMRNSWLEKWNIALGAHLLNVNKEEKIYPSDYKQSYTRNEGYLNLKRNFLINSKGLLDVKICGAITNGSGSMLEEVNPLTTGALLLNRSLLEQDYAFQTAGNFKIGAGLKYSYVLNSVKGISCYGLINYTYNQITGKCTIFPQYDNSRRNFINIAIGLNF